MTERAEQWICIRFCAKLEHSSVETIWMIHKAAALGNWWLAASSWQHTRSCITSHAGCFCETSNQPGDSAPYSPDLVPCDFWLFPKLKSPLKWKRFQTINEIQEKMTGAADSIWENCVRSQGAYFEGDWAVIVLCTMVLVSSSINVSIFHITWMDTFWTDLVCASKHVFIFKCFQYMLLLNTLQWTILIYWSVNNINIK